MSLVYSEKRAVAIKGIGGVIIPVLAFDGRVVILIVPATYVLTLIVIIGDVVGGQDVVASINLILFIGVRCGNAF